MNHKVLFTILFLISTLSVFSGNTVFQYFG